MTIQEEIYYDDMIASVREDMRILLRKVLDEVVSLGYTADIIDNKAKFEELFKREKNHMGNISKEFKFMGKTYNCLIELKRVYIFNSNGGIPLAVFGTKNNKFYPLFP